MSENTVTCFNLIKMSVNKIIVSLTLLYALCRGVESIRVLGIFPIAARSHYILGNSLMRGLAEAGHNVTIISPYEGKNPPKQGSYRDVVLTGFLEEQNRIIGQVNLLDNKNQSAIFFLRTMLNMMSQICEKVFIVENVQNLLKSDEKFDVIIVEQFMIDVMKIFGQIYNAPVIAFSTVGANPMINKVVGNPTPLSYQPLMDLGTITSSMNFWQRIGNVFTYLLNIVVESVFYFTEQNRILRKYFPTAPDIFEIYHNVDLALVNSHESLSPPSPRVPNMIDIGGFHIKPPKKLPKDLQNYLDDAKEGVVYFSMGSNLKSKDLPAFKRDAILKAFGKLKEKVLWKWEDDELPGKPDNVKVGKWLPQQDILAHPNVKLFITHSGLLSTTETVYHGVPILAIPVFGDQHQNARVAVSSGYALCLPYEDPTFSEEKLSGLLNELLTNPKYTENVKRRSKLFHDRPMKPMETAVYWVEYIARNGGAHLRVAGVDMPWYKYHSVDVIGFLFIISLVISHITFIVIRKIVRRRSSNKSKKNQKKSKRE